MYLDGVSRRVPSQRVRTWIWRGDAGEEITRAATSSSRSHRDVHPRPKQPLAPAAGERHGGRRPRVVPSRPAGAAEVGEPALPLRRILVAIDGTDPSRHLVDSVRLIAKGKSPEIVFSSTSSSR